jgi:hypothetical protein
MDFKTFKLKLQNKFEEIKNYPLFNISIDKGQLWDKYLDSFPEGTNPIYKERTIEDCNACKSFINNIGGILAIKDDNIESIWDIQIDGHFQVVADAMSNFVKNHPIENVFLHTENSVGVDKNHKQLDDGNVVTFEHLYVKLPKELVKSYDITSTLSDSHTTYEMLKRSLEELTLDSIDTVLELVAQNSLYRGEEHKFVLDSFKKLKKDYDSITSDEKKNLFCWVNSISAAQSVSRIRNTVIGSLLIDLSKGKDLELSIKSFETKVAPTNYHRPTSIITKGMIEQAQAKVEEIGLTSALQRRYAVVEDITVNNIIFVDRSTKKRMENIFDELAITAPIKTATFDKVEEVSIEKFIKDILPTSSSLEIMFENRHISNLVSLIAPEFTESKNLFKWENNFSWSYNGDLADSIKERVKKAGGRIDGDLRCSLSWFNYDDLDLHMEEPKGFKISYNNKISKQSGGQLDVDMNAGSGKTRNAVENIVYVDKNRMVEGNYILKVNNFCKRENIDGGFEVEIEFDGVINNFSYPKMVADKDTITVALIEYSKKNGLKITGKLPSSETPKSVWGINTQNFHKVSIVMNSPNYWNDKTVGNKHFFFMIENCVNDGQARGFFNEFLSEELIPHRKVMEVVGSKMKVKESNNQLSGLGFSSTQRNSVLCRVQGKFSRIIKILF